MLKLENNKICKLIFEHNFAQRLNFSYYEKNTLINTADVINVNKMKNKEFFVEIFLNIFVWMLQFTVVAKLLLITDFFNLRNENWLILNCCNSRTQIHKVISENRDSRSDRDYWNYSDDFDFQEVIVWNSDSLEFDRHSTNSCNDMKLTVLELL